MPAWEALQSLITMLKTLPAGVVPGDHIGLRRPSVAADLPRIAVSVAAVQDLLAGIGGVVGSRQVSNTAWVSDTGLRTTGSFAIELWAADETTLGNLATAVFGVLEDVSVAATAGFDTLSVSSAGPIDLAPLSGAHPPGAAALRLPAGCGFSFEAVTPVQTGPDGIIKQVHVDVTGDVNEAMDLP